ncbi:hemolysin family protein [Priestia endophytica]|uniref:hemolysin family protein n=1 Tax=Priestia endophytica TaxID=135735 RepID=UPI00227EC05E|nr:hemolysin family protein [Priestia endophytica]MCY8231046.1 hemolysin family protein [Priestia endophytica]
MIAIKLVSLILLLICSGFFVASEFAIVKVRASQLDQRIKEGNKQAIAAKKLVTHLDEYLSVCQLGITLTSLGLGWLGEPTIHRLLLPLFEKIGLAASLSSTISFVVSFALVTFLHVVTGELAPKTFAIYKAEKIVMFTATPLIWFYRIFYPFIWFLNTSARVLARMFGFKAVGENEMVHSEEEIRLLIAESYRGGEINSSELQYVQNVFEFDNRLAREIMVPRTEMFVLQLEKSLQENLQEIKQHKFTRYPVVHGDDKDQIVGMVNVKDLYNDILMKKKSPNVNLSRYVRPVIQVIDSVAIHDLLLQMQKENAHLAVLFDEYGGTSGIVTLEDIVEEIVGEIRDEFDIHELPYIEKVDDSTVLLDGKVLIAKVNELLDLSLEDDEVDTISGWLLMQNYDVKEGDTVSYDDHVFFTVKEMNGKSIQKVEVKHVA